MKQPLYYTPSEGGIWFPWSSLNAVRLEITEELLNEALKNTFDIDCRRPKTYIGKFIIHSLLFGNYWEEQKHPRWDCVNGWTTPLNSI